MCELCVCVLCVGVVCVLCVGVVCGFVCECCDRQPRHVKEGGGDGEKGGGGYDLSQPDTT